MSEAVASGVLVLLVSLAALIVSLAALIVSQRQRGRSDARRDGRSVPPWVLSAHDPRCQMCGEAAHFNQPVYASEKLLVCKTCWGRLSVRFRGEQIQSRRIADYRAAVREVV